MLINGNTVKKHVDDVSAGSGRSMLDKITGVEKLT